MCEGNGTFLCCGKRHTGTNLGEYLNILNLYSLWYNNSTSENVSSRYAHTAAGVKISG